MRSSSIYPLVLATAILVQTITGYDNGVGQTPPMGWQTWCSVGPCGTDHCYDGQIRAMADALVENGMKDLGYKWVVLDDCWHPKRDKNGTLVPDKDFFPNGMKPVIDYVHSKGLKFGLYTSVGDKTCHGGWSPGSLGHYQEDADLFASWEVDYVKIDYCGKGTSPDGQKNMSEALNKTGRPILFELCRGPYKTLDHYGYAPEIAQAWRASSDHKDRFESTMKQVEAVKGKGNWSGPYGWAYLDMMMIGGQGCKNQGPKNNDGSRRRKTHAKWNWKTAKHCPGQTDNEYRTEASLYTIVSSALMIGTDVRLMTPIMKELLLNNESIAINQDYKAQPGDAEPGCDGDANEVWVRRLSDGDFAIAMTNLGAQESEMSFCLNTLKWPHGTTAHARNVWAKKDLGIFTSKFTATIASHDTLLLRISKDTTIPTTEIIV